VQDCVCQIQSPCCAFYEMLLIRSVKGCGTDVRRHLRLEQSFRADAASSHI